MTSYFSTASGACAHEWDLFRSQSHAEMDTRFCFAAFYIYDFTEEVKSNFES